MSCIPLRVRWSGARRSSTQKEPVPFVYFWIRRPGCGENYHNRTDPLIDAVCAQLKDLTIIIQKLVAWHFAGPLFFCNFASAFHSMAERRANF